MTRSPDRIHATLYDTDGKTRIGWLRKARNITWTEQVSKPGWATFEVPLDDPLTDEIADRRIVKFWWIRNGRPLGPFACRVTSEKAQLAQDGTRWLRFENQPGLLSMLADAVVYPERGLSRSSPSTRLFGFMSADGTWRQDGNWTRPRGYPMSQEKGLRKGHPPELKQLDPDWIASVWPETHVPPSTVNYYRASITLATGKYALIEVTADNFLTLYHNGEQILQPDYANPLQWRHAVPLQLHLDAGEHTFAAKVENAPLPYAPHRATPVGLIMGIWEINGRGKKKSVLLETSTGSPWLVHDNTPPPGWHRAQVLRQLVLEAQDRGVDAVQHLRVAFGDFRDSRGDKWTDRGEYQFDTAATNLADAATQLSESALDVGVDPRTMHLHAWRRQGKDRCSTVQLQLATGKHGVGELKSYEVSARAARFTRTLSQLADGSWQETADPAAEADAGRIESGVSLGSTGSPASAADQARALLAVNAVRRVAVTSEPSTLLDPVPYRDYHLGDTITVPEARYHGTMRARVLALTVDGTGDRVRAWPEYAEDLS